MAQEAPELLIDYIHWRGDLPLDLVPFNDVDNVILCELSYLDCSEVLHQMDTNGRTLREIYQEIKKNDCFRLLTVIGGNEDFVAAAANSERFGTLRMSHYLDEFDAEKMQFAAVHFELSPQTSYIAFRGTDNSIIGWREDFMTGFTQNPGQEMALHYLNVTMRRNRDYYLGGHSKGGNHAVYAASQLTPEQQRHILRIYNNDGPEFSPDVYDIEKIDAMKDKITKIVPAYDVIGQLFSRGIPDTKIVVSSQSGFLQHDAVSWCLDGPKFKTQPNLDPAVKIINDTFRQWVENAKPEERRAFVKQLFDGLVAQGAVTLEEVKLQDLKEVLKTMLSSSETARMVKDLPITYLNTARKYATEAIEQFAEETLQQLNTKEKQAREKEKQEKEDLKVKP